MKKDIHDVKDKVVVISVPDDSPVTNVQPLAQQLREEGAAVVVILSSGYTLETLDDEQLAACGLGRINGDQ